MSEDYKRKLDLYEKGELTGIELEEFELELEKLEKLQETLEENQKMKVTSSAISDKKMQRIMRRSKWKARLQTAFSALGLLLLLTIVSTLLTSVYYSWGKPDRMDVFRNVIDYTLTVTDPYGYIGGTSMGANSFFGVKATRDLNKVVGRETKMVGELEVNFLFSKMSDTVRDEFDSGSQVKPSFAFPANRRGDGSDWKKLESLPEGTVVSAYVSFDKLLDTNDVFKRFEGKDLDLIWLAVYTGVEAKQMENEGYIRLPIGFPRAPIWHEDDMIIDSREVEKGLFGSQIISESSSSPDYSENDQNVFHKQFLKTLNFLKDHEEKANKIIIFEQLGLSKKIEYLKKNGIQHYGVVITGPTKEVLKLKDESWVRYLVVDEVEFWNWD